MTTPTLTGLSHITVAVSDLTRAFDFYVDVLGMTPHATWRGGAYLSLGELWFCLSVDDSRPAQDDSHIAFAVAADDFPALAARFGQHQIRQWKDNRSEGDSWYILDPDGHKLEIHVGDLHSRLRSLSPDRYPELHLFQPCTERQN